MQEQTISKKHIIIIFSILILYHAVLLFPIFSAIMPNGGDTPTHFQLLQETEKSLKGEPWWSNSYNMGFPMFLYYAPLPYIILAALHIITFIPLMFLFKLSIFLFFISFPLIIFKSAKLFNLTQEQSCIAAIVSLFFSSILGFGIEHRFMFDFGLFSQLWGLFFLPLAAGYAYQYFVEDKKQVFFKTILFSWLTFSSHLFMGVLVAIIAVLLFLAAQKITVSQIKKMAYFVLAFGISVSYFVVPYFTYGDYYGGLEFDDPLRANGYGISKAMTFFATAQLLDFRSVVKVPLLSLLFVFGIALAIYKFKTSPQNRFFCYSVLVGVIGIAGKQTFGFISFIPILNQLQTFRFITLIHFAAIFLIAISLSWILNKIRTKIPNTSKYAAWILPILIIVILLPALIDNGYAYKFHMKHDIKESDQYYASLLDQLSELEDKGRILIKKEHIPRTVTHSNSIPPLTQKSIIRGTGIGYHDSLSTFFFAFPFDLAFDPYELYNLKYVVDRNPQTKQYQITQTNATGYFSTGFARFRLNTGYQQARYATLIWTWSGLPLIEEYFLVSQEDVANTIPLEITTHPDFVIRSNQNNKQGTDINMASAPTVTVQGQTGRIDDLIKSLKKTGKICGVIESETAQKGHFTANAEIIDSNCFVILKVSYHPDWHATVDNKPVQTYMVSPSFIAVPVPEGKHTIDLTFKLSSIRIITLIISLFSLSVIYIINKRFTKGNNHNNNHAHKKEDSNQQTTSHQSDNSH